MRFKPLPATWVVKVEGATNAGHLADTLPHLFHRGRLIWRPVMVKDASTIPSQVALLGPWRREMLPRRSPPA